MANLAMCPFCGERHRTRTAFLRCRETHGKWTWTKDGKKVLREK